MNQTSTSQLSSFTFLNITQFLGVLNDNIYKLLLVFLFIELEGIEYSYQILSLAGAIFVLPFLLFSASSGTLADRFSKRNIIVLTKVFELLVTSLGVMAFYDQNKIGSFVVLFLLATQSAIFGPSKYSIIPEIVEKDKISHANGLLTTFTFLAVIIGTFLASFILDITGRNYIIGASMCVCFSIIGLITSFCITYTPPSGSQKRFSIFFLKEIFQAVKLAKKEPSLLIAMFGSAYFLFLASFVQLNIIPFAVESLHLSEIQGGYLFLLTAVGIGSGAYLTGRISGKSVELGIVPFALAGITVCLYLLGGYSSHLLLAIPLVILLGMLGGTYEVPVDSYIQVATPSLYRGQMIAATNFFSFIGVLISSFLIYFFTAELNLTAAQGFSLMGTMTLVMTFIFGFQFFPHSMRLLRKFR